MSLEEHSADTESTSNSEPKVGGQEYTTKLAMICTAWVLTALAVGIGFVAFNDVFMGFVA